jgi:hypothetical protein
MAIDSFVIENNSYDLLSVVVRALDVQKMVVGSNSDKNKD